jgi:hypothetical protein
MLEEKEQDRLEGVVCGPDGTRDTRPDDATPEEKEQNAWLSAAHKLLNYLVPPGGSSDTNGYSQIPMFGRRACRIALNCPMLFRVAEQAYHYGGPGWERAVRELWLGVLRCGLGQYLGWVDVPDARLAEIPVPVPDAPLGAPRAADELSHTPQLDALVRELNAGIRAGQCRFPIPPASLSDDIALVAETAFIAGEVCTIEDGPEYSRHDSDFSRNWEKWRTDFVPKTFEADVRVFTVGRSEHSDIVGKERDVSRTSHLIAILPNGVGVVLGCGSFEASVESGSVRRLSTHYHRRVFLIPPNREDAHLTFGLFGSLKVSWKDDVLPLLTLPS